MADYADIVTLGASEVKDGIPLVQAKIELEDDTDTEDFGKTEMFQALGLTSVPWPASAEGKAEGVVLRHCGGYDAVCVGARDVRTAPVVGNAKPGDTILHSTGPNQAAQLQLKEEKRQAVLVTKGADGKQLLLALDGKSGKVTIAAFGMVFEMNKDAGTIALISPSGSAGLVISDAGTRVIGPLLTGSGSIPLLAGGTGSAPVPGVFV